MRDITGREWDITSKHDEECSNCGKPITCYQTEDGGIIEHLEGNGFLLWGPFGLCKHCDDAANAELKELTRRPK